MARGYTDSVLDHLRKVEEHNASALAEVTGLLLDCIRGNGIVLTAGAGHSLAAVAESFYRAGGLACVWPVYHPELLPTHGAKASTTAERRSGLAAEVLADVELDAGQVLVVFSTSGVNPYPVELAVAARKAGCPVVAVTSLPTCEVAPRRAESTLAEQATVILDTLVPPGDSGYPVEQPVTAPLSSLCNVFVWNQLLVRLFDTAAEQGVDLPLWRSANLPGNDDYNATLFDRYGPRIPQITG